MGIHGRHGSSKRRNGIGPFHFPMVQDSGQALAESSGCPQIAPLALGSQLNISFPSQIFLPSIRSAFTPEPSPSVSGRNNIPWEPHDNAVSRRMHHSTASTSTSGFPNTSGMPSYLAALPGRLPSPRSTGGFSAPPQPSLVQSRYDTSYPQIITHQPSRVSPSSISTSSGTPSPLEVSLNIGNSIHVLSDDERFIRKATMRGLVQYLLGHPEGEP